MDDKEATAQGGVGKRLKFRRQAQGGEGHAALLTAGSQASCRAWNTGAQVDSTHLRGCA